MKISREMFNERTAQFVKSVLIPSATASWTKFKLGFALGTGAFVLDEAKASGMRSLGVVGPDGSVDVDRLKNAVYAGLDATGGFEVPGLDVTLYRADADRYFRLLETGEVS